MHLEYALLAEAAELTRTHKLAIMGGNIEVFHTARFPAVIHALSLVVSLRVDADECGRAHRARLELLDKFGANILADTRYEFTPYPNPPETAHLPVRYTSIINLNGLALPAPGTYTFRFRVDDDELGSVPVLVVQTEASGVAVEA